MRILDGRLRAKRVSRSVQVGDRRRQDIHITVAGHEQVREVAPRMIEPQNRAFSGLGSNRACPANGRRKQ